MRTKRTWAAIMAFALLCSAATGCTNSTGTESSSAESNSSDKAAAKNAGNYSDTITLVWYPNESAEDYQAARDEVGKLIEEEGEFVSIIGPSGAGKSTILRCINRLIDATEGKIIYNGADVMQLGKSQLRQVRTKTGMIFQHYNLVDRLSVMENVLHGRLGQKSTFSGMIGHYTEAEKTFAILSELGLAEQAYKRCDALSGGQKQRVGIARAIMQEPKLILCDEPNASLDPKASKTIMDHLAQINQTQKITCIVNLHQVDVAMKYSQRILGVTAGKVVFDGSPSDLTQEKIHEIYQSNTKDLMLDMQGEAV